MKLHIVYDSPPSSAPSLNQALQCPSAPRKYRFAKGAGSNGSDPMFFPSSSSVFGSTCATESTFDTSVDSLLESFNLPAGAFALKPGKPGHSEETQTPRRKKLSIGDVKGDIPPLPYKSAPTKSSSRTSSEPDKKHKQATSGSSSKADSGPMRRMSIKHLGPRRRSLIARGA